MFGDLSGMMDKLKKAQEEVEKTKLRLDSVLLDEVSSDGKIKITLTANRKIKSISIDDSLLNDAEELEDLYGNRVRSRMRELFNLVAFDQDTNDKRK